MEEKTKLVPVSEKKSKKESLYTQAYKTSKIKPLFNVEDLPEGFIKILDAFQDDVPKTHKIYVQNLCHQGIIPAYKLMRTITEIRGPIYMSIARAKETGVYPYKKPEAKTQTRVQVEEDLEDAPKLASTAGQFLNKFADCVNLKLAKISNELLENKESQDEVKGSLMKIETHLEKLLLRPDPLKEKLDILISERNKISVISEKIKKIEELLLVIESEWNGTSSTSQTSKKKGSAWFGS